jgi:hypothetical protein
VEAAIYGPDTFWAEVPELQNNTTITSIVLSEKTAVQTIRFPVINSSCNCLQKAKALVMHRTRLLLSPIEQNPGEVESKDDPSSDNCVLPIIGGGESPIEGPQHSGTGTDQCVSPQPLVLSFNLPVSDAWRGLRKYSVSQETSPGAFDDTVYVINPSKEDILNIRRDLMIQQSGFQFKKSLSDICLDEGIQENQIIGGQ